VATPTSWCSLRSPATTDDTESSGLWCLPCQEGLRAKGSAAHAWLGAQHLLEPSEANIHTALLCWWLPEQKAPPGPN